MRLERINQIFPNAIYIYIKRDVIYTAQSIILARRKLFRNDDGWFSVKPQNYETLLELDPFEQVISQIVSIENYVFDLKAHGRIPQSAMVVSVEGVVPNHFPRKRARDTQS